MGQTNGIGTAPRDELELNNPVELGHELVAVFPVAIQPHDLGGQIINHQDVGRTLALALLVVLKLHPSVDVKHSAHAVNVV